MATQNINIVITANGGVTVVRSLQQIAQAAQAAISPLNLLQRTLQSVMAALAVRQLADWADEWTTAANKVAVFAQSQAETNEVLERLYNVANRVGQPLNSVVDLYHKLSIQSKELGISTNDNIRFTENVSKALTIQGTSANTAKGTLLQLSQAMGTGKVKAQEYNSILTGAPLILKLVAENIDKTGGSVAKLTAMQRAGHLTSMMLYNGIMSATAKLDEMWGKATRTFEQGWTVLINGITKFLGKLNEATGASNTFYKIATFLSENFDTIAKLLIVVGAGIVAAFAPAIITAFAGALVVAAGALGTLSMLLLANPFAVIAAAVAAVIAFGDSWSAGIDGITTVKDLARALWEELAVGWDTVKWAAIGMWTDLVAMVQTVYNDLTGLASGATGDWITAYTIFFDDTKGGFVGLLQSIARVMDAIAGLIIGTVIGITRVFSGLPAVISDIFAQVYNAIAGWMEKAINVVIDGINTVRAKTGAGLIDAVKIEQKSVNANVYKQYGESIGASINEGFDIQGGFMEKKILGWADRAQQIAKKRLASQGGPRPDLDVRGTPADIIEKAKKGGKGPKDNSENELEKLRNQLRSLLDKIDPVNGAILEMAKAQDILNRAVERGLISDEQRQKYLERLTYYYRDMIDPIQKVYRELDIEAAKMDGLADERERNNKLYDIQVQLMQAGKPANAAEIEVLKTKILLNQQLNEQMQIQDQLIANGPGTRITK